MYPSTYTQIIAPTHRTNNTPRLSAINLKLVAVLALVERLANSHGSSTELRGTVRELRPSRADNHRLVCSARACAAITDFKNLYTRDSGFFNGHFLRTFLSMLRHRQFHGAAEIAKHLPQLR